MNIALFASGSGTNVENIANYFKLSTSVKIALVVCNNPDAYVLERAKILGIPSFVCSNKEIKETTILLDVLVHYKIDFIVLAGFLRMIPTYLINAFPNKMVNIHPALLPKYGGKGMYGHFVHEAVVAAKEKESGITIHFVNEYYDEGAIIFQATCPVLEDDSADDVAKKIHKLEYEHFPKVIEQVLLS